MSYQPKSYRKFLATATAAALVATAVAPAAMAATPSDIKGQTGEEFIQRLLDADVLKGNADGTFNPGGEVQRRHAAIYFTNALQLEIADNEIAQYLAGFDDVNENSLYAKEIAAAVKAGIFNATPAHGKFNPVSPMSREHMAVTVVKALELEAKPEVEVELVDLDKSIYADYITILVQNGVVQGSPTADGKRAFLPQGNTTRGQLAVFLVKAMDVAGVELPTPQAPVTDLVVESVSAIAANKIAVEFNTVVDQDAAEFEVKLGFVPQDVTVEFSEDGKTAHLVSENNFVAGEYTVTVDGVDLEISEFTVEIEAQTLASFSFATERITAVATQPFKYVALDQYGNEFDVASSNFTPSARNISTGGSVTLTGAGNEFSITTDLSGATLGNKIVVTLVHNTTGLSQSKTFDLEAAAYLDTIVLGTPAPRGDNERIYVSDTSDELVLPITLLDQYGQEMTLTTTNGITFISSNPAIVNVSSFAVNADDELTFRTGSTAGNVTITAISQSSGKSTTSTFAVSETAALKTVNLSQPSGLVVANEEVKVSYQAVDTYGKSVNLTNANQLVWVSTNRNVVSDDLSQGHIEVNADGELLVTPQQEGTVTLSAFLNGQKQGEITLNAKEEAVATKITGLSADAITYFNTNEGTYQYSTADFRVVDQYNRVIRTADLTGAITVAVKDSTTNVVTTSGDTVTAANNTTTGSKVVTATYTDGGVTLTRDFTVNVIADTAVVGYKLTDVTSELLLSSADASWTSAYAETITIEHGLDKDNRKVALSVSDASTFLVTTSNAGVVTVTGDTLAANSSAANNSTATVTVFKKGLNIGQITFTVSTSSPVLSTLTFREASRDLAIAATADSVAFIRDRKDQYNRTISLPGAGTWFSSNSAVASVGASTGVVTGVARGEATITFVAPNGVAASYTVKVD